MAESTGSSENKYLTSELFNGGLVIATATLIASECESSWRLWHDKDDEKKNKAIFGFSVGMGCLMLLAACLVLGKVAGAHEVSELILHFGSLLYILTVSIVRLVFSN